MNTKTDTQSYTNMTFAKTISTTVFWGQVCIVVDKAIYLAFTLTEFNSWHCIWASEPHQ